MTFPPGRPLLLLCLASLLAGFWLLWSSRQPATRPHLLIWTFDASHAAIYRDPVANGGSLLDTFELQTGHSAGVRLIQSRALDARLISLFHAHRTGQELPDLVEVEIGSLGRYLRSGDSPLLPLEDLFILSPLATQIIPARLKTYTVAGHILGIPHDLHPVTLTYRKDLFDQAGVNLAACETWMDFQDACLRFQRYWADAGQPQRRAIALSGYSASELSILLLQQSLDLIGNDGQLHLDQGRVAQTLAFYTAAVAGPRSIAGPAAAGDTLWIRDLAEGRIAAAFTPDWRIRPLRQLAPQLSGKLAMMPLPRFNRNDAPTSTWGGTMLAIPRHAANPRLSWQLLEFILASDQALAARRLHSDILPPLRKPPPPAILQARDPYFSNQPITRLYYELGQQIPPHTVHPYTPLATQALASALADAVRHVESHGEEGLETWCQTRLAQAQASLARIIEFDRGDQSRP